MMKRMARTQPRLMTAAAALVVSGFWAGCHVERRVVEPAPPEGGWAACEAAEQPPTSVTQACGPEWMNDRVVGVWRPFVREGGVQLESPAESMLVDRGRVVFSAGRSGRASVVDGCIFACSQEGICALPA